MSRRPPAARAARRARDCRPGSGCSPRRRGGAAASSPVAEARAIACRVAAGADELALHYTIRRTVFCREQGMFGAGDDRDPRDAEPTTLHAVGAEGALIGGTVRLYPLDDDGAVWQGDRLAVLPAFRHGSLGGSLVRLARRTAGAGGGARGAGVGWWGCPSGGRWPPPPPGGGRPTAPSSTSTAGRTSRWRSRSAP